MFWFLEIFENSRVPLEGMYKTTMESMDTINPVVLQFIKMNLGVVDYLECRRVDDELMFEDYQPKLGDEVPSRDRGQQLQPMGNEALLVDIHTMHMEIRDGFRHVHSWMQSVDTQMQSMATWMKGMDSRVDSLALQS